jgi:hypothetical protein
MGEGMKRSVTLHVALSMALYLLPEPSISGELYIYEHNGSIIDWYVLGDKISATYNTPRSGVALAGISRGTKLFDGHYEGDRIVGTAFAFKAGCTPAPYEVIGRHKGKRIILTGPAPVRDGCKVVRHSATSPHASLVLIFSATHH